MRTRKCPIWAGGKGLGAIFGLFVPEDQGEYCEIPEQGKT